MKRLYRNIRAMQSALHQTPEVLKSVCVYAAMHVLDCMIYHFMLVIFIQSRIGLERIGVESGTSLDVLPNERLQIRLAPLVDNLSANSSAAFNESDYHGFVIIYPARQFCFAALVHVPRFSADEGFVHFNFAVRAGAKFAAVETILQCRPKTLKHEPCGLLSDSQRVGNFHAANTVLAVNNHPASGHPLVESKSRILKDRSNLKSELLLASVAEPNAPRLDERVLGLATSRASDLPSRPAQLHSVFKSALRIGEVNDGLLKRSRY